MKKKFLLFLNDHWFIILLNTLMLIGTVFSNIFGDIYIKKNTLYSFNLHSIYVLVVLPIYSLIYGCISYVVYKRLWSQQILLAIALLLAFLITELIAVESNGLIIGIIILTPSFTFFSILSCFITKIIYKIIGVMK